MNKTLKIILILALFVLTTTGLFADNPPDPGGGPTGDPVGGGSPIGGGLIVMMISGLLYGTRRIIQRFRA